MKSNSYANAILIAGVLILHLSKGSPEEAQSSKAEAIQGIECPFSDIFFSRFESGEAPACPGGSITLSQALSMIGHQPDQCIPPFTIPVDAVIFEGCYQNQCGSGTLEGCDISLIPDSSTSLYPDRFDRALHINEINVPFRAPQLLPPFDICTLTTGEVPVSASIFMDTVATPGGGVQILEPLAAMVEAPVDNATGCPGFTNPLSEILQQRLEAILADKMIEDFATLECAVVCSNGQ